MPKQTTRRMIKYKSKKRATKRTRTGKLGAGARNKNFIANIGRGMPERLFMKMVYHDCKRYNASAGAQSDQEYRLTSVYDPDKTGVGGQPNWYDKIYPFYRAYVVRGAKYTIEAVNNASVPVDLQWIISGGDTIVSTSDYTQMKTCRTRLLGAEDEHYKFSQYRNNIRDCGLGNSTLNQASALVSSNVASPSINNDLILKVVNITGAGTIDVYIKVTIDYFVEWFDLQQDAGVDA